MADQANHQSNIEAVRNLLSPYLDGEVTEDERSLVEQTLAASPELKQELELMRQMIAQLTALPRMPAPRPFTLSEADGQPVPPPARRFFGLPLWFSGFAALATALVCVLAVGWVIFGAARQGDEQMIVLQSAATPVAETVTETTSAGEASGALSAEEEATEEEEAAPAQAPAEDRLEAAADLADEPAEEEEALEEAQLEAAPAEAVVEVQKEVEALAEQIVEQPAEDEESISEDAEADKTLETERVEAAGEPAPAEAVSQDEETSAAEETTGNLLPTTEEPLADADAGSERAFSTEEGLPPPAPITYTPTRSAGCRPGSCAPGRKRPLNSIRG